MGRKKSIDSLLRRIPRTQRSVIMSESFLLQESRQYVGHCLLWWGPNGNGYVSDISKAQRYTREEAISANQSRHTDIPWPASLVESQIFFAADMQLFNAKDSWNLNEVHKAPDEALFYIQQKHTYNGNDFLFLTSSESHTLTPDVNQAGLFDKQKILQIASTTQSFNAWPCSIIQEKQRPVVHLHSFSGTNLQEVLLQHEIELYQPKTPSPQRITYRCAGCGRIMSSSQMRMGSCVNCGTDNRP